MGISEYSKVLRVSKNHSQFHHLDIMAVYIFCIFPPTCFFPHAHICVHCCQVCLTFSKIGIALLITFSLPTGDCSHNQVNQCPYIEHGNAPWILLLSTVQQSASLFINPSRPSGFFYRECGMVAGAEGIIPSAGVRDGASSGSRVGKGRLRSGKECPGREEPTLLNLLLWK